METLRHSVSIFGLGYVGSVMAARLAHKGNRVVGVDVNPAKVATLNSGHSPILEKRMDEFVAEGYQGCRLRATTDANAAVDSDISFVCVGTPSLRNGKLDLSNARHLVVLRSIVTNSYKSSEVSAALTFTLRDVKTGNPLGGLTDTNAKSIFERWPIQPEYPPEVTSSPHRGRQYVE